MQTMHATAVAIDTAGILLRGPAGCGKSDLALRLIEGGAMLIADDQVELRPGAAGLTAACPKTIAGKLEVRGLGIVTLPFVSEAPVSMVVDLVDGVDIDRLPTMAPVELLGCEVAHLRVAPFEASAPTKIRLAVRNSRNGGAS